MKNYAKNCGNRKHQSKENIESDLSATVRGPNEITSKTSLLKLQLDWIPKSTKKLEISIIQEASKLNASHYGQKVKLEHSSSFDALCHLFALAYNYHPNGHIFDAFNQPVFQIAVKLAKK